MLKEDRDGNIARTALNDIHQKHQMIFDPKLYTALIKFDIDGKPFFEFALTKGLAAYKGIEHACPNYEFHDKATLMLSELIYDEIYKVHLKPQLRYIKSLI
mgnify:CR=1 FL=1